MEVDPLYVSDLYIVKASQPRQFKNSKIDQAIISNSYEIQQFGVQ